jgi:hypothetical protein
MIMKIRFVHGLLTVVVAVMLTVAAQQAPVAANADPAPTSVPGTGPGGHTFEHQPQIGANGNPVTDANGDVVFDQEVEIPKGATPVTDTTSTPLGGHQGGEIVRKFRNDSKSDWRDFHIFIPFSGRAIRIGGIDASGSNAQTEPVDVPGNTGSSGVQIPLAGNGTITNPSQTDEDGAVTNPNESTFTVEFVVEYWDDDSGTWKRLTGSQITFYVWGTHGMNRDLAVTLAMPNALGHGDDRVSLLSVFPDFDPSPLAISDTESGPLELNHLGLGETDGHRFHSGSAVIMPGQGMRFAITKNTRVRAFNMEGEITGSELLSTSNLRVDDAGNLVFEVSRTVDDDLHAAIVITGLKLQRLPDIMWEGHELTAGIGGAILGGRSFTDVWTLAHVSE